MEFDLNKFKKEPEILKIKKPPCESCCHWTPQREYFRTEFGYFFSGIRLCHRTEMNHDFSCYSERKKDGRTSNGTTKRS